MKILETERLLLREIDADDAAFTLDLLNQPSFIKYIGDRGVRDLDGARDFIESRYRKSYRDHGYGLYVVELKAADPIPVGVCGFVRRDTLPGPDIGFAFLPQFEKKGFAYESASAVMEYGRDKLGFTRVLAITTTDNDASGKLLEKLGFRFEKLFESNGETLKLFSFDY
jgi:RimJ/RimL family protein N-acetyltransferase